MKDSLPPLADLISLDTAHDVRNLRKCGHCLDLGNKTRMIEIDTEPRAGKWMQLHGRCFIAAYGVEAFFALPDRETDKVCIGDVGHEIMKELVGRRSK